MGYYAYCDGCGEGLWNPDLKERLAREIVCNCGEVKELDRWDYKSGIDELLERLSALEALVVP